MSGEIFIETTRATFLGLPVSEHLYLVYRDGYGDEFVLRAGPENGFWPFGELEIEVNVAIDVSADRRGSASPDDRSSTPLDFGPLTDDQAWGLMVKYAGWIEDEGIDYRLLDENSNSFIGALLHAAGGEPDDMLPKGVGPSEAIGFSQWDNIVDDIAPPEDWILRGTAEADQLTGSQIDDDILGLAGPDRIHGLRGDDLIRAGRGHDRVWGGEGNDEIRGGAGNDVLRGGAGDDVLRGGTGNDRMIGGAGADVFVFRKMAAGDVDTVLNFDPAEDSLDFLSPPDEIRGTTGAVEMIWDDYTVLIYSVPPEDPDGSGRAWL